MIVHMMLIHHVSQYEGCKVGFEAHFMIKQTLLRASGGVFLMSASLAQANNVGENAAWQFQTTSDRVNRAYLEEMRQRHRAGPPIYNTYIDRQFNCNVNASALGNQGTNTTLASSAANPTVAGSGSANDSLTELGSEVAGKVKNDVTQDNTGAISTTVTGTVTSSPSNQATQALNSDQANSGAQSASVSSSSGCSFASGF